MHVNNHVAFSRRKTGATKPASKKSPLPNTPSLSLLSTKKSSRRRSGLFSALRRPMAAAIAAVALLRGGVTAPSVVRAQEPGQQWAEPADDPSNTQELQNNPNKRASWEEIVLWTAAGGVGALILGAIFKGRYNSYRGNGLPGRGPKGRW